MRYIRHSTASALAPKLIGAYERELHTFVERALASSPDRVVDIGSAEGYYAVGCALRLPNARVHAFDSEPLARELCGDLAQLNGVADRVQLHGLCTPTDLAGLTPSLIICDCEGAELELLDPVRVPGLADSQLIVEMHDFVDPRISSTIAARFAATHMIETVSSGPRNSAEYAVLASLKPGQAALALEESRPCVMDWAYIVPRR
jgi:hypothetical protein